MKPADWNYADLAIRFYLMGFDRRTRCKATPVAKCTGEASPPSEPCVASPQPSLTPIAPTVSAPMSGEDAILVANTAGAAKRCSDAACNSNLAEARYNGKR